MADVRFSRATIETVHNEDGRRKGKDQTMSSDTNETRGGIKPENGPGASGDKVIVYPPTPNAPNGTVLTVAEPEEDGQAADDDGESDDEADGGDEVDDEVPDGTVLEPGYHIFEIATRAPCKQDVLLAGLTRLGITSIRLDQSRPRSAAQLAVREHRFLANVTKRLELHQERGAVRWLFAQALDETIASLFARSAGSAVHGTLVDVRSFRFKLEAYDLEQGMLYEALFLSRERSQPTRLVVEEHLNEMGFMIHSLTCIQKDVRLADRPGVSVALWFGLLEWDAPASVVTEDDPFYFESLIARS